MANYPPLQAISAAVYTRLSGDSTLVALAPVVNDAGEDQEYPYLLIGGIEATPWHTLGGTASGWGWRIELTLTAYSRYSGDLEAIRIIERAVALLNFYEFSIAGYTTTICELDPDSAPTPIKLKVQFPNKVEERLLPARFCFLVH